MGTVRVLFLETRTVQREDGPTYVEGEVYELALTSAQHFVSRGVAKILVEDEAEELPKDEEQKPAEAEGSKDATSPEPVVEKLEGEDGSGDGKRAEQLPPSPKTSQAGRRSGNRN